MRLGKIYAIYAIILVSILLLFLFTYYNYVSAPPIGAEAFGNVEIVAKCSQKWSNGNVKRHSCECPDETYTMSSKPSLNRNGEQYYTCTRA